jgi:hypothetical protein
VNDGIHRPEPVHLLGHIFGLLQISQISDHHLRTRTQKLLHCIQPLLTTHVNDHLMAIGKQRLGRQSTEAVCRTGNENSSHELILRVRCRSSMLAEQPGF